MGSPLKEAEPTEIDFKIGIWSMRPQPGTPLGETWEQGCRQGWEWGCKEGKNEIENLKVLLRHASSYIPTGMTECNGYKCREANCASCNDMDYVRETIKENDEFRALVNEAL